MPLPSFRNTIYNCKQASFLIQKKQQKSIRPNERIKLFIHLLFCDPCKLFLKQSRLIDSAFHQIDKQQFENPSHQLTEPTKIRLQSLVDNSKKN
jgi:hypothetical protein